MATVFTKKAMTTFLDRRISSVIRMFYAKERKNARRQGTECIALVCVSYSIHRRFHTLTHKGWTGEWAVSDVAYSRTTHGQKYVKFAVVVYVTKDNIKWETIIIMIISTFVYISYSAADTKRFVCSIWQFAGCDMFSSSKMVQSSHCEWCVDAQRSLIQIRKLVITRPLFCRHIIPCIRYSRMGFFSTQWLMVTV